MATREPFSWQDPEGRVYCVVEGEAPAAFGKPVECERCLDESDGETETPAVVELLCFPGGEQRFTAETLCQRHYDAAKPAA